MNDLFDTYHSPEAHKDLFEKRLLLDVLKKGKITKRNDVARTIFYLAGMSSLYKTNLSTKKIDPAFNDGYDRRATLLAKKILTLQSDVLLKIALQKYISSDMKIVIREPVGLELKYLRSWSATYEDMARNNVTIVLQFNQKDIKWWLIDYDLKRYHSKNIRIDKNTNYAYVKKSKAHVCPLNVRKYLIQ